MPSGGPCGDGGYHVLLSGFSGRPLPCIVCGKAFLAAFRDNLDFYRADVFVTETLVP